MEPECDICSKIITIPKSLPCGHTFCMTCIEKHISSIERHIGTKINIFPCLMCKKDVNIPDGGARNFPNNFKLIELMIKIKGHSHQPLPSSTTEAECHHKQKEVKYYCNDCNIGLCYKCMLGQHKEHETLDIECDETRNKAIEKLERSQNIIKNRIKKLEKTRSTLLQSFEELKSLCEDSCTKVTEKTEQIVSDVRKGCEQIVEDIRNNLEENRKKVEDREMEITSEINLLDGNMESNISPSTKTTLNILQTLHRLLEIEKQDEKDYNLCVQYLQWVGKDFSLDIDRVGSVISKESFYIPGSYQFIFDITDIKEEGTWYYSKNKFRNNNLVWSCVVVRKGDEGSIIRVGLPSVDNPKLNYCTVDYQISLLNINDGSQTITNKGSNQRFETETDKYWGWKYPITVSKLSDKNHGYINSNNQLVVRFDILKIKEISWK